MRISTLTKSVAVLFLVILFSQTTACSEAPSGGDEMSQADIVSHGAYIANAVAGCFHCHSPDANNPDAESFPLSGLIADNFVTPNITQDLETGIGTWSDADIENALRKGKRPDGSDIHPVMPWKSYARMTEDDMSAVITWLRTQQPVSREIPRGFEFSFPSENFVSPPLDFVAGDRSETVDRGAYLVTLAHCLRCHTPVGETGIDYAGQPGAGGNLFGPPDAQVMSINLTTHQDSPLTHYSDAELANIIKSGTRPDGSPLAPIMGARPDISDSDMTAILAFLRTLPPVPYPEMVTSE